MFEVMVILIIGGAFVAVVVGALSSRGAGPHSSTRRRRWPEQTPTHTHIIPTDSGYAHLNTSNPASHLDASLHAPANSGYYADSGSSYSYDSSQSSYESSSGGDYSSDFSGGGDFGGGGAGGDFGGGDSGGGGGDSGGGGGDSGGGGGGE